MIKALTIAERIIIAFVLFMVILGVYFSKTDLTYFEGTYVREDGLIEWLTVLALAVCAIACFYRSNILRPFRGNLFSFYLILMGLVFVFGVGEEISWGQRLLGIKSPEFFMKNNAQMETNFHNLIIGDLKVNRFFFGKILGLMIILYVLVMPYFYRKKEKFREIIDGFAIPVPRFFHISSYITLVLMAELVNGGKKGELLEFGGCWIFMLILFNPLNRSLFSRKTFVS